MEIYGTELEIQGS
ncbi:unnamed protein product, partial [Rotaria sordida]